METFNKKIEYQENHVIVGDEDQLLQVLLYKYDTFVTKKEFINYFSSNVETREILNENMRKSERKTLIELNNQTTSLCYIGVYGTGGKIIKILPNLYNELYVRFDNVLGFAKSIELDYKRDFNTKAFSNQLFYFVRNDKTSNINYNSLTFTDYRRLNEFIYLQNPSLLIEKRLGQNEEINLLYNSVIAFEGSIQFKNYSNPKNKLSPFVVAEGPGLIIFQACNSTKDINSSQNWPQRIMIFLLFVIIYSILIAKDVFIKYYSK